MKLLVALLIIPFAVFSQEFESDRPNETEGTSAVESMRFQVESGINFERDAEDKTFAEPVFVIRYGIIKNLEFRVESAYTIPIEPTEHAGLSPIVAGVKYHILDHAKLSPDVAILGRISLPWLATKGFEENYYSPELRLLFDQEFSKTFHLGYNLGLKWSSDDARCHYLYSISAEQMLTKKLIIFIETYADFLPNYHTDHTADIGLLFQINSNLQLDVIGGKLLSANKNDNFGGFGVSYRI